MVKMKTKIVAEFLGSMFLLMIIVGSGIMGEKLANGNEAIILLVSALATGAGLFVLIQNLGQISGAHFNPLVSYSEFHWKRLSLKQLGFYWFAQICGAIVGVFVVHYIFDLSFFQISKKNRFETHFWVSEIIASFGLIVTIILSRNKSIESTALAVSLYITSAYFFTSSTSFANPAASIARMLTNSYSGISPAGVFPFIVSQAIGMMIALIILKARSESNE